MTEFNEPFPHSARFKLDKPPIVKIIAQISFHDIPSLFASDLYVEFANRIGELYPNGSPVRVKYARDQANDPGPGWEYSDKTKEWLVSLQPSSLSLETYKFEGFTSFLERFKMVVASFRDLVKIDECSRIGLRYFDNVDDREYPSLPDGWLDRLSSRVFGTNNASEKYSQLGRLEQIYYRSDPEYSMIYRAEYRNSGFANSNSNVFTLDMDSFKLKQIELGRLEEVMHDLKELCHNAFSWTFEEILENLKE